MDIFIGENKYRFIAAFLAFAACTFMVALPDISLLSAQKGIALWASDVLPALLPFFICAGFMNALGVSRMLPRSLFVFSMSVLSGYPMGAKLIGDMRRKGEITLNDAKLMISFSSTSGPAFLLGSVGAGMLESVRFGTCIAVSHYMSAILTGVIFNLMVGNNHEIKENYSVGKYEKSILSTRISILSVFTDSIFEALKSLGIILAYIVLFMFAGDLVSYFGILDFIGNESVSVFIRGLIEMTVGCSLVSALDISKEVVSCMISFLVSFGGLSVIGQSMSMLSGSGVSLAYFILVKLCHGLCSALITCVLI